MPSGWIDSRVKRKGAMGREGEGREGVLFGIRGG